MKMTLNDISKKTGYSTTTISRVLNGKSEQYRISLEARDVILEAVKEMNYQPDIIAQSLRNNITYTIGLLVPHIENPFFANIASVVIRESQKRNYTVVLIDTLDDPEQESKAIDSLISRKMDGIIIVPVGDDPTKIESVASKIPIVLIDRYYETGELSYVSTNNYQGALLVTKLLLNAGHKDILCISGPERSITTKERVRGYKEAMKEGGCLDHMMIKGSEFSIQNGYIETKLALNTMLRPTAIFALSSTILLGIVKAVNEHNISIPQDISVVSFDDNLFMDYLNPPITRVAQPIEEIGVVAVKLLMQKISNEEGQHSGILLEPILIQRNSIRLIK